MMQLFLAIASIVALATTAPTPQHQPQTQNTIAIVYVRLIGDSNQYYSIGDTQVLPASSGHTIPVHVGSSLDFSSNGLLLQGAEIAAIGAGTSLGGVSIVEDDGDVICRASLNGSSEGVEFRVREKQVLLNEGRMVKVTGLSCWVEKDDM